MRRRLRKEREALATHLEDDGVEVELLELVKERHEFRLLLC